MKNHTEKEFRGNLRGIGLSLLTLIAIAIPRLISKDFDIVFNDIRTFCNRCSCTRILPDKVPQIEKQLT